MMRSVFILLAFLKTSLTDQHVKLIYTLTHSETNIELLNNNDDNNLQYISELHYKFAFLAKAYSTLYQSCYLDTMAVMFSGDIYQYMYKSLEQVFNTLLYKCGSLIYDKIFSFIIHNPEIFNTVVIDSHVLFLNMKCIEPRDIIEDDEMKLAIMSKESFFNILNKIVNKTIYNALDAMFKSTENAHNLNIINKMSDTPYSITSECVSKEEKIHEVHFCLCLNNLADFDLQKVFIEHRTNCKDVHIFMVEFNISSYILYLILLHKDRIEFLGNDTYSTKKKFYLGFFQKTMDDFLVSLGSLLSRRLGSTYPQDMMILKTLTIVFDRYQVFHILVHNYHLSTENLKIIGEVLLYVETRITDYHNGMNFDIQKQIFTLTNMDSCEYSTHQFFVNHPMILILHQTWLVIKKSHYFDCKKVSRLISKLTFNVLNLSKTKANQTLELYSHKEFLTKAMLLKNPLRQRIKWLNPQDLKLLLMQDQYMINFIQQAYTTIQQHLIIFDSLKLHFILEKETNCNLHNSDTALRNKILNLLTNINCHNITISVVISKSEISNLLYQIESAEFESRQSSYQISKRKE